jgi:hypothetical protein
MANKIKFSQLSIASSMTGDDTMSIIQNNTSKKLTVSTFLKNLNSTDTIRLNPISYPVDVIISSHNDVDMFHVSGSGDKVGISTAYPESKFHVNGNIQVGSASTDGVIKYSTETISYATTSTLPISVLRGATTITVVGSINGLFSLGTGTNGQIKTITAAYVDGSSGKTISITFTGIGYNKITLNAVGKSVMLQYISANSAWSVIGGNSPILEQI